MGVHSLVTGLNGAGKSLYTVSTKLLPLSKATIAYQGQQIPRRLVVGGIPDLLLPHELMAVPELDPESSLDPWGRLERERGSPPVEFVKLESGYWVPCASDAPGAEPLEWSILNWWAWCSPGDVLVVDEAQRVFRPMPSGRRVPRFIAKLEIARHYGVEFIYMTQHPQLLHVNLRNLIGPHEDVRRIFGSHRVMVYLWDKCSNPDRIAKATGRVWKHDKKAFGLYKSSELHTKFKQRLPLAVWAVLAALLMLGVLAWMIFGRLAERYSAPSVAASAPQSSPAAPIVEASGPTTDRARDIWPVYRSSPSSDISAIEPYRDLAFEYAGGYDVGGKVFRFFRLVSDGRQVAVLSLAQLVQAGYSWTEQGPCVGVLAYGASSRRVACSARPDPARSADAPYSSARADAPNGAASAPTSVLGFGLP